MAYELYIELALLPLPNVPIVGESVMNMLTLVNYSVQFNDNSSLCISDVNLRNISLASR